MATQAPEANTAAAPATPNAAPQVTVTARDLPLHCPQPGSSLWNSHPRVFLPIDKAKNGSVECPYCGTRYTLQR